MLEFIGFLNMQEKYILDLIYRSNFSVIENAPACSLGKRFFGFLDKPSRTLVICTENAKNLSGKTISSIDANDFSFASIYIRRALRHEAVHAAQLCNDWKLLNMIDLKRTKIHPYKKKALKGSTNFSGYAEHEQEAYLMEDSPVLISKALLKFCFD